ncbi:tRNA lysidine(34) synthetase TilS [Acidithiobacillus sp. IBUN Pt1247-S3]|uniref:tRNA lysidine(34) synthetase TilS n=1 Tax=Acidithiobacillus sp. IBUN Pt1247-S3 TaxID=3166642 RepID=UPI0034E61045
MVSWALPEPEACLRQRLFSDWKRSPEQTFFLACSGGADSTALLHAAYTLGLRVQVLHVNHHWHPDSERWAEQVVALATGYGYPCRILDLPAEQSGEGPEDRARRGRYALFAAEMRDGDWLLSAQHQDDQAETLILQLLRGAGIDGLAAMQERRPLGAGILARPFLGLAREQLREYLRQRGIVWLEDPANADMRYARTRVRQHIWPLLHELGWPQASASIARSAGNVADQLAVEDAWYAQQLRQIWPEGRVGSRLSVGYLQALHPPLQRVFLRRWLRVLGIDVPDRYHLERLRQLCASEQGGKRLEMPGLYAWRQGDQLQVWGELPNTVISSQDWQPHPPGGHGDGFLWRWGRADQRPEGLDESAVIAGGGELQGQTLCWSWRQPGARYRTPTGQHRPLKKLLLEAGVPPFLRDTVPILWTEAEEILWIPGFYQRNMVSRGDEVLWLAVANNSYEKSCLQADA